MTIVNTAFSSNPAVGSAFPLGAMPSDTGTNFSLFTRTAERVQLLFFDRAEDLRPSRTIDFDPRINRTFHYWHIHVPDIRPGQLYAYRVSGPFVPAAGLRFDETKSLLDPYGRVVVTPPGYDRFALARPGSALSMKSAVADPGAYDWEGDVPLKRSPARTVIYEMHVRGFTRDPSSEIPEEKRGTFAGLIEKIPYLRNLGITAIELLPVFHFDAQDCPHGGVNYWGYAPISFFAPHDAYSSRRDTLGPLNEFRDMVKALHRAGIEVLLDVVFNHTAEGDENGPTLCFRGIENSTYYILAADRARYANYSGTGNTLNANNPIVRRMILDSLRYWVTEMHVDGFRFDLASILSRDPAGCVLSDPPVVWDIESDPALAGTKLIAEAWDASGLYQVGSFAGNFWREWNGRFRDDARDFLRAADGSLKRFADRLIGSPEVYGYEEREPEQSINFVTCHDGFTLEDLVSYQQKHNEANGEGNADGSDDNRSWNCGVEGPSVDSGVESLRKRQIKNFLAVTLLSLGVPMILMGDEVRRTQRGNNNAYCQDNEISWFDWSLVSQHMEIHRFVRLLIERRLIRDIEHEWERISLNQLIERAKKAWHGVRLNQPDWRDCSHSIAFSVEMDRKRVLVYFILNAYWQDLRFELPSGGTGWHRWIDTALETPLDIVPWSDAPVISCDTYLARKHSLVVLWSTGV